MPEILASVIPTGGAVSLSLRTATSGTISLERATSGMAGLSAWTTLYSGAPYASQLHANGLPMWSPYFDIGDLLPAPLSPSTLYVYRLTDIDGSAQTDPILPAVELDLQPEPLTTILMRLLQAGINSLLPPTFNRNGGQKPQVLYDMPLAGFPPLPFITVNLRLLQQEEVPIGQNVSNPDNFTGVWTLSGFAKIVYVVTVLSENSQERDFYRDAVIGIFNSILGAVMTPLGKNIRHSYQASNGQVAQDIGIHTPGFYYSDIMIEFQGTWNITITTTFGLISTITFTGTTPDGTEVIAEVATA